MPLPSFPDWLIPDWLKPKTPVTYDPPKADISSRRVGTSQTQYGTRPAPAPAPITYGYTPPAKEDLYGVGRYPGMGTYNAPDPFEGPLGPINERIMRSAYPSQPGMFTPAEQVKPYADMGAQWDDLEEWMQFPAEDYVEVTIPGQGVTGGRGITDPTQRLGEQMTWLNFADELRKGEGAGSGGYGGYGYGGWGGGGGGSGEAQSRQPYRPNMSGFVQQLMQWRGV